MSPIEGSNDPTITSSTGDVSGQPQTSGDVSGQPQTSGDVSGQPQTSGNVNPPPPPSAPPAENTGDGNDGEPHPDTLPAESLELGAGASRFVDNPDAPPGAIAQQEVLPDESLPSGADED